MASDPSSNPSLKSKSGVVSSAPWSHVVAATSAAAAVPKDPAAVTAVVSVTVAEEPAPRVEGFVDGGGAAGNNGGSGKSSAWKIASDGGESSDANKVMNAYWPELLESARARTQSPPKGSVVELQGVGSAIHSPQMQSRDDAGINNSFASHRKAFRRSNSNPSSNGRHTSQVAQVSVAGSINHNNSMKDHQSRSGYVSNDHPQQQHNSFRNRNGGPYPRGDGVHHHNYVTRRDQRHGNHDWNSHRNFNARDNGLTPRFAPRWQPPPPPNPAHLYPPPPPPIRPFGGMGFSELHPQMVYPPPPPVDSLRGVPFVPPIPPNLIFFQPPDPHLYTKIVNQIDYYFSDDNLIKDLYLRQKMDNQGWVPISLIAGFKKVKQLTDNIQIVVDAVRTSSLVEVLGDKIRRRNDWGKWIYPPVQFPNVTSSRTVENLVKQVQGISLDATNNDGARGLEVGIQFSNHSISARN